MKERFKSSPLLQQGAAEGWLVPASQVVMEVRAAAAAACPSP
jgi:hypothetical protein